MQCIFHVKGHECRIDQQDSWLTLHTLLLKRQKSKYKERLYLAALIEGKQVPFHRLVMSAPPGRVVDHIDGNALNNTRANLRICSVSQNSMNRRHDTDSSSGYKGVAKDKRAISNPWNAAIQANGVRKHLGRFPTADAAHAAYVKAAKEIHGEFTPY